MDKDKNKTSAIGMGNRYELRSKRKERLEPKKDDEKEVKEVSGTNKGRKKRAVLSTSTPAAASASHGDGVHVTHHGSGDLASTEMTFSINHIREQIFRSLLNRDLNNCRLVSRSWNSFASLELQKRIRHLCFDFETKEFPQNLGLLNKRPELMLGLPLPSSNFWFCKDTYSSNFLKNRAMHKFLDKYGPAIKELSFTCEWWESSEPDEKKVIDFVTNLLLHQTPNLSKLKIKLKYYSTSWVKGGSTREWDSTLLASDPEFKEIHSKTWGTNSKLKVLNLTGVSAKLLEVVTKLAPNLREINAKGHESHENDCGYFMEPLNRLGLLKKIQFHPNLVEELQVFEKVCELSQIGGTSLKLREISFGFVRDWDEGDESRDMLVRGEKVINHLLECSWDSLETIKWCPSTGLPGVKWPEVLPNVQKLTISRLGKHKFLNGFSWSTIFPKLKSLSLSDVVGEPKFTVLMDVLFENQKVESVKDVHVHAKEDWSKKDRLTAAQLKRFQNIFPNAEIGVFVPRSLTPAWAEPEELKVQKRCGCY